VGSALGAAILAHRAGDWAEVISRLSPIRSRIRRIGGSHAQRDLFEEMLIDAALKSDPALARRLLAGRLAARPRNLWAWRQEAAAARALGDAAAAQAANDRAAALLGG